MLLAMRISSSVNSWNNVLPVKDETHRVRGFHPDWCGTPKTHILTERASSQHCMTGSRWILFLPIICSSCQIITTFLMCWCGHLIVSLPATSSRTRQPIVIIHDRCVSFSSTFLVASLIMCFATNTSTYDWMCQ